MTDEIIAEFKPNRWRLLWRPILFSAVMAAIVVSISETKLNLWWLFGFVVLTVVNLFVGSWARPSSKDAESAVNKHVVMGPPMKEGRPTIIPVGDVEIALSRHLQGGFDKIAGKRWLYSTDAKKIMVLCDGFPQGTFEQILNTIVRLKQEGIA